MVVTICISSARFNPNNFWYTAPPLSRNPIFFVLCLVAEGMQCEHSIVKERSLEGCVDLQVLPQRWQR